MHATTMQASGTAARIHPAAAPRFPVMPPPAAANATPQPWDAFDALEEGLAVHDRPGRQLYANAALLRLAAEEDGLSRDPRCGAVLPTDPVALRLLQRALAAAACGTAIEVAVPRASGAAAYLLRCAPVPGNSGWVMVRVSDPVARRRAPSAAFLRSAFGLTAAEAMLAIALCGGDCLAEFAGARGISIHTARTQLRALLAKTRTDRQAELVGLLTALSV
jgi:DNA-binding CsgD family transcriptional regulator